MRVVIFVVDSTSRVLLYIVANKDTKLTSIASTFQIIGIASARSDDKQLVCFVNSVALIKSPWGFQIFSYGLAGIFYGLDRSLAAIYAKFVAQVVEDLSNEFFFCSSSNPSNSGISYSRSELFSPVISS